MKKSLLVKILITIMSVCAIFALGLFTGCYSEKMYEELEVAISNESTDLGEDKTVYDILSEYKVKKINNELMSFFVEKLEPCSGYYICDTLRTLSYIEDGDIVNDDMSNMLYKC